MISPDDKARRCVVCGAEEDSTLCERCARSCALAGEHAVECACDHCDVYMRAGEALRDAGLHRSVSALSEVLTATAALALEPWQERTHGAVPVPSLAHVAPATEGPRGLTVWRDGELVQLPAREAVAASSAPLLPPPPRKLAPPATLGAVVSMLCQTPDARPCAARLLEGLEEEGVRTVLAEMFGARGRGGGYRSVARWVETWLRHGPQAADAVWATDCAACESSLAAEGRACRLCREEAAPTERTTEEIILPPSN